MQISDILLDDIIQPIAGETESGIDPRIDISPTSAYYQLKDIRNNARAKERNVLIDDESVLTVANDWKPIVKQVPDLLINHCKDLEFVAWFIEALCRLHGFKGLSFGFTLATRLIEDFWPTLYPTPEPDDIAERLAPLIGLNGIESEGALIQPIKAILITQGASEGPFSTWQYEQAYEVARLDEAKQAKRFEAGAVSLTDVEVSIKETEDEFFITLYQDVNEAVSAFSSLSAAMDKAMNGDPQPTSYISKSLSVCANSIHSIAADILKKSKINEPVEQDSDDATNNSNKAAIDVSQQIHSRTKAISQLDEIASYFRETEPHSPMSYAIEQVIRWSGLTLPELLQELIQDGEARNGFFKLSGIKTEEN